MVRAPALILVLALASCSFESEFERAERRYNFIHDNRADSAELCAAANEVAQAAIDEGRGQDYQLWKATADLHCNADLLSRI